MDEVTEINDDQFKPMTFTGHHYASADPVLTEVWDSHPLIVSRHTQPPDEPTIVEVK